MRICMSSFVCTYVCRVLCAHMYVEYLWLSFVCTYVCQLLSVHMYVEFCVRTC